MKIRAKKSFLLCFRPLAIDEPLTSHDQPGSSDQVFAYIAVADKGDLMIPTILQPLPEKEISKFSAAERAARRPRKGVRRIFSAMVNSIFSESKLKKELRNRKVRQDPYRLDCSKSAKSEELSKLTPCQKISDFDDLNTDSSVSSSSSSSSSSSRNSLDTEQNNRSVGSIQISSLQEPRQKTKKKNVGLGLGRYSSCYGLLLFLISFSIVIFWGRLCAILCTSTWLYLAHRMDIKSHIQEDVVVGLELPDIDSKDYKKRVIMEGLLERSHHA